MRQLHEEFKQFNDNFQKIIGKPGRPPKTLLPEFTVGTKVRVVQDGYIKKWFSDSTDIGFIADAEYRLKRGCKRKGTWVYHIAAATDGKIPYNVFTANELEAMA